LALEQATLALALWKELDDRRAEALEMHAVAQLQLQAERPAEAAFSAQEALAAVQEARAGRGHDVAILATLVTALVAKGEFEPAVRAAERRIAHYQADEDWLSEALALLALLGANLRQEAWEEALQNTDKALVVLRGMRSRSRKSRQVEAQVLHDSAEAHMALKAYSRAEEAVEDALRILKDIEDFDAQIQVSCTLSYVSMHLGEWRDAMRAAGDSRDVARQEGDRVREGVALLAMCCAVSGKGDHRRASGMAREAQELFFEEEHPRAEANALYMLANVLINSAEHAEAVAVAKRSQKLYKESSRRSDECNVALLAAHAGFFNALKEGAPQPGTKPTEVWDKALQLATDALGLSRRNAVEVPLQVGKCLLGLAQVHALMLHQAECQASLDEAFALARKQDNESLEAYALTLNAQMFWVGKQEDLCPPIARQAEELFERLGDESGKKLAKEMTKLSAEGVVVEGDSGVAAVYQGPTEEMLLATINEVALSLIGNESLAADTPLMDAGLDSLASVEFQNTLAKEFKGTDLPSTLVFDYPTPKEISQLVYGGLQAAFKSGN